MAELPSIIHVGSRVSQEGLDILIEEIKLGGMGLVAIGTNQADQQRMVLKTYQPVPKPKSALIKDLFIREAINWVGLWLHPNLLRAITVLRVMNDSRLWDTFDVFQPFIVLDFAPDGDLRRLLRPGQGLPVDQALAYAQEICSGLLALHTPDPSMGREKPLIHRDLKPENILRAGDRLMLTDFGLAKVLTQASSQLPGHEESSADLYHTRIGQGGMGTAAYMPPEQWRASEEMETPVDIYAVGVILAELFTGRYPWHIDTGWRTPGEARRAWRFAHDHTAPLALHDLGLKDEPTGLEAIYQACLAKSPAGRPTIAQLLRELQVIAGARGPLVYLPQLIDRTPELLATRWNNLGVVYRDLSGQTDASYFPQALDAFSKAVAHNPRHKLAWRNKSGVHLTLKQFEAALEASDRALALDPSDALTWDRRCEVLFGLQRYADGIAALDRAVALEPRYAQWWNNIMLLLLGTYGPPQYQWALVTLDRAITYNPRDFVAWANKASILNMAGRRQEAGQTCDQVLALHPDNTGALHIIGSLLMGLDRAADALATFEHLSEIEQENFTGWQGQAKALLALHRYAECLIACDRALTIDSTNIDIWQIKTDALIALHRYPEVIEACERTIELAPNIANAWFIKGASLAMLQHPDAALAALNQGLALDSKDANAWKNKAVILRQMGRAQNALDAVEHSLALVPTNCPAWSLKIDLLQSLGQLADAAKARTQSLQNGCPEYPGTKPSGT